MSSPADLSRQCKISVLMVTYNHENYIGTALESVFSQRHPYAFEIVVGDDASTDRTAEIVTKFAEKYPGTIRLVRHATNVGHSANYLALLEVCRGEYVALLDGDDYWTHPDKLKWQIEFLDRNPDFSLSCHRFHTYWVGEKRYDTDICPELYVKHPEGFEIKLNRFFSHWVAQTLTVVVRRSAAPMPELYDYEHFTDMHIFFTALQHGRGWAHGFFGGVYNMHGHGLWSRLDRRQQFEFNLNIISDLMVRHPNCAALVLAYKVHRWTLLWIELGEILSGKLPFSRLLRLPRLLAQLLSSSFEVILSQAALSFARQSSVE